MSVIDKPGYYASKAGKCEVVVIGDGGWAIGWNVHRNPYAWAVGDGLAYHAGHLRLGHERQHDITGPYVEPRKPVEAWCVIFEAGHRQYFNTKGEAEYCMNTWNIEGDPIHLREYEDS